MKGEWHVRLPKTQIILCINPICCMYEETLGSISAALTLTYKCESLLSGRTMICVLSNCDSCMKNKDLKG